MSRHRFIPTMRWLLSTCAGAALLVAVVGALEGCQARRPAADNRIVLRSVYPTLPPKEVPEFLKDTILEKCDLIHTEPFPISGYGLVVNLAGTGDSIAPNAVREYIVNEMIKRKWGSSLTVYRLPQPEEALRDPRNAIVQVDGYLPPGVRRGQRFDVQVSALPESNTGSLAGGSLFETDLRIFGANPNDPAGAVNVFGRASGPVFVNPAYALSGNLEDPAVRRSLRYGVVMNGAAALEDRALGLRLRQPSMRMSRFIEDRIDQRMQEVRPDVVAAAQDEGTINLLVPNSMNGDWEHFAGVVTHLYLNSSPEFSAAKARQLCDEALKPGAPLMDISYCWEGLGKVALTAIRERELMSHANDDVAFAAARAAAFLGDPSAPQALVNMARKTGHRFQVNAVQVLGALPRSPAIDEMLRPLLDSPETLVRIEAYKMLAQHDDSVIFSTPLRSGFTLDIVRSSGPPVIYATRRGEPRLALIGNRADLLMPVAFSAMENRLSITSDPSNRFVTIFYRRPMPRNGARNAQEAALLKPVQVVSETDLAQIVARLAGEGENGLGFNYGEIISILSSLTSRHQVVAMAGGDRMPASFVLQELPQVQDSIHSAPVIPDHGRPQTDDEAAGRQVGRAE